MRTIKKKWNVANCLGYAENVDDDLSSVISTNPVQTLFLHIFMDNLITVTSYSCDVLVELKFYTKMYDLKY